MKHRIRGVAALLPLMWISSVGGQAPAAPAGDPIPFQKNAPSDRKLWGYADAAGRLIIPAQFETAGRFGAEGLAPIKRGGRWGMIDRQGREVIPARHTYQVAARDGRVGVCLDSGQQIPGVTVLGPQPGQRTAVTGNICGYLDRDGAVAIPFQFTWIQPFQNGVAPVSLSKPSTKCPAVDFGRATLYGLVDTKGTIVMPIEQCYVGPDEGGWIRVVYEAPASNDAHVGFVDRTGKVLLAKLPYDFAGEHWWGDLLPVRSGNRWGFVDRQGKEIIPIRYDDVSGVAEGRARVSLNGKWGFLDAVSGHVIVPPAYDDAGDFSDGLACVKIGDKTGFIDTSGKLAVDARFEWNWSCRWPFSEGVRPMQQGGKWGYIDRRGTFVIAPAFDDAWGFSEGLAAVKQGAGWGFVDKSGKLAVPASYFRVDDGFIDGLARVVVRIGNPCCPGLYKFSEGYIDHQGREFFDAP